MNDLGFRLLVAWYRLLGASAVQAEWKARRALKRPGEAADAARATVQRTADERFHCVCGQLLVVGDKTCHACGRRQWLPAGARRVLRTLGLVVPTAAPAGLIIGVLILLGYVVEMRVGGGGFVNPLSRGFDLYVVGAAFGDLVVGSQPWRAVTYIFLHGGFMHLLFNGIALLQVGPLVEREFGSARYLFCFMLAGVAGVAVPALIAPGPAPVVGASGALFGLIGMALIWGHRIGTAQGRFIRDVMVRWVIYATLFGFMIGGVAHGAHFAGLGAGILCGWLFPPARSSVLQRRLTPVLGLAGAAILVAGLAAFGLWTANGRPVPEGMDPRFRLALLMEQGRQEGFSAVLGDDATALLGEARDVRQRGLDPVEVQALVRRADTLAASMSPEQRLVFRQMLAERLQPERRLNEP
ncbi:MAG: rhomboid family intramembrane serine protease [Myxococcales bacterium]|nr:rhomboid family intramembrane serine protease [Myxococcales bacterium]